MARPVLMSDLFGEDCPAASIRRLIARRNAILDKRSLDEQDRMALDKLESRPSCRSANCMIAVHKPGASPEILETRGREENACNQKAYEKAPADYDSGTLTLSFRADLYGHDSVKEALIAAQHGKCCFCESKLSGYYYADFVKGDRPESAMIRPGGSMVRRSW
jgi:hypothetical protein